MNADGLLAAWRASALAIPLVVISVGTASLWTVILELTAPGLFAWLSDLRPVVWQAEGRWPVAEALACLTAVVVAPMAEEIGFRGLLLSKWRRRWGSHRAALLSSLVFGLVHIGDPIGAVLFGWVLAVLVLRTRSLSAAIVVHGSYNFVLVVAEWFEINRGLALGWPESLATRTLVGTGALLVGVGWFLRFHESAWRLGRGTTSVEVPLEHLKTSEEPPS